MSPNKLTDAQLVLLSAAWQREDGAISRRSARADARQRRGRLAIKAGNQCITIVMRVSRSTTWSNGGPGCFRWRPHLGSMEAVA